MRRNLVPRFHQAAIWAPTRTLLCANQGTMLILVAVGAIPLKQRAASSFDLSCALFKSWAHHHGALGKIPDFGEWITLDSRGVETQQQLRLHIT